MSKVRYIGVLVLVLIILSKGVSAQFNKSPKDSVVVFEWLKKADHHFDLTQYDSAIVYAKQAFQYSQHHHYFFGETWSLIKMNDAMLEKDQLTEATRNADIIYRSGLTLKDSIIVGIAWLHRGQAKMYNNEIDSAIYYLERGLSKKLELVKTSYTGLSYNELGYAWGRKDNEDKMMDNCLKGLAVYETIDDPVGCAMTLGNIATIYSGLGQKQKAIDFSKRSMQYRLRVGDMNKLSLVCSNLSRQYLSINLDSSAKYQRLCEEYAVKSGLEHRMAEAYITSAIVSSRMGKKQEAYDAELKAIKILEKSRSDLWLLSNQYLAVGYYAEMLQLDSSTVIGLYDRGIELAQEIKSKSHLQLHYDYKSQYYLSIKKYEQAYLNYKKSVLYKDSIALSDQKKNVDELETRYQTAKKDLEIERLNADQKIKQLEIEKQQAIITGNTLEAKQKQSQIDFLQQQKQLQQLLLTQREEQLQKEQLASENRAQELELLQEQKLLRESQLKTQEQLRNGLIAGSILLILIGLIGFSRYKLKKRLEQQMVMEEMRNTIASDLHDDIGASLSNINILNEMTRRNASDSRKVNEYLLKASEDIRQVSDGISDIVWNINPRYDNIEHLFVRMKRYASDLMDAKDINYQLTFPAQVGESNLNMNKRRDLYLLFKEAVNNLAKYSKAKKATIQLMIEKDHLKLTVSDDGVGFDTKLQSMGNGLRNMKHRATQLGGQLQIESEPGRGTNLNFDMPI